MTHPKVTSTTDHAGPRVVGVTGTTLRHWFNEDPASVPYVYRVGNRYFVSTPLMHKTLHGDAEPWTDCQGCWALGSDKEEESRPPNSMTSIAMSNGQTAFMPPPFVDWTMRILECASSSRLWLSVIPFDCHDPRCQIQRTTIRHLHLRSS